MRREGFSTSGREEYILMDWNVCFERGVIALENRKDLATILNQAQVFYLATADEDGTPHVRPFGAVARYEGHTWFCTGKGKAVYSK